MFAGELVQGWLLDLNTIRGTFTMRRRTEALLRSALLTFFALFALSAGQAIAQTSDEALSASEADQSATESAFQALNALADARAGDPAFDYQLGIAALDAGRYGEAIIALTLNSPPLPSTLFAPVLPALTGSNVPSLKCSPNPLLSN